MHLLFLLSFFWQLLDNQICQLFQQLRERQQQERNNHIEDGVHQSNTSIADRPVHKDEVYKRIVKKLDPIESLLERIALLEKNIYTTKQV